MSIKINSNMLNQTPTYLDDREYAKDLIELKAKDLNIIPEGFEVYVESEDCKYKYNNSNAEDETLGKWRKVTVGIQEEEIADWEISKDYVINDKVKYNNAIYKSIKEHTSSTDFETDIDNWIEISEEYIYCTKEQYDYMEENNLLEDKLYIVDGVEETTETTGDYEELTNKPTINGVELKGDKSLNDLSLYSQKEIDDMLYPILHPYVESTINITTNGTLFEVGTTNNVTFTIAITKGRDDIKSIKIIDKGTGDILKEISTDPIDLTQTYTTSLTKTTTIQVIVNDGTKDITKDTTINFVNKSYYGVVNSTITTPTENEITTLTGKLNINKNFTYSNINMSNQKVVFAYPKSFGVLSKILDANNFDYINSYNRQEIVINSVNYYVYIMKDVTSISNGKQIYS